MQLIYNPENDVDNVIIKFNNENTQMFGYNSRII